MDSAGLSLEFSKLQVDLKRDKIDSALERIDNIYKLLYLGYFIPQNVKFSPKEVQKCLANFVPYLGFNDKKVRKAIRLLIHHFISVSFSYSPDSATGILIELSHLAQKPDANLFFLFVFGRYIQYFDTKEITGLLQNLVLMSDQTKMQIVSDAIWSALHCNLPESEISSLIYLLNHNSTAKGVSILVGDNTNLLNQVFDTKEADYLVSFLSAYDTLIEKETIIKLLENVHQRFEQIQIQKIYATFLKQEPSIDDECLEKLDIECIPALVKYEKITADEACKAINWTDESELTLKAIIACIESEDVKQKISSYLLRIAPESDFLIQYLPDLYPILCQIDKENAYEIVNRVLIPLHTPVLQTAEFLTIIPTDDFHNFHFKITDVTYSLAAKATPKEVPTIIKLFQKHDIEIRFSKFDWLGNDATAQLLLFKEAADSRLVLELLGAQMIPAHHIPYALELLRRTPEQSAHLCFDKLVIFLQNIVRSMGIDIISDFNKAKVKIELDEAEPWATRQELKDLFNAIKTNIIESEFGKLLISTIQTIILFKSHVHLSQKSLALLTDYACFVAPYIGGYAYDLVGSINQDDISKLTEQLDVPYLLMIRNAHERLFKQKTHKFIDYVPIARAAIKVFGEEQAMAKYNEIIMKSIEKDRWIALQYCRTLKQPLPLMPTFLSFASEGQHSEWIEKCRKEIPYEDWILDPNDYKYADFFPDDTTSSEPLHLRFAKNSKTVVEPIEAEKKPIIEERHYEHKEIENVDDSYKVIAQLWHGTSLRGISNDEIEDYALEHSGDIRMVLGFLSYAKNHSEIEVHSEKWLGKIKVSPLDDWSIYAASLLIEKLPSFTLDSVEGETREFLINSLSSLSIFFLNVDSLAAAYRKEQGVRWLLVRAIIAHTVEEFESYPFIQQEIECDQEKLIELIKAIPADTEKSAFVELLSLISTVYFYGQNDFFLNRNLPTNCALSNRLLSFYSIAGEQHAVKLSTEFVTAYRKMLKRLENPVPQLYTVLFDSVLSEEEYFKVFHNLSDKLPNSPDTLRNMLFGIGESPDQDFTMGLYIDGKAPSYQRAYQRAVSSKYAPSITKYIIKMTKKKLLPIFPELAIGDLEPWDCATLVTKLRLNMNDNLQGAIDEVGSKSTEAIEIYKLLMKRNDSVLSKFGYSKLEITQTFIKAALQSTVFYAYEAFMVIKEVLPIDEIAGLLCSRTIIDAANFPSILVVFALLEKELRRVQREDLLGLTAVFHEKGAGIFDDEKAEVFAESSSLENIEKALEL